MILADTSVWVDHLRGSDAPETLRLVAALDQGERVCICGLVLTEILQGVRPPARRNAVRASLQPLIYLATARECYYLAADLFQRALNRGRTVRSTIDCVIAAVALHHDVPLLHRDRDFDVLASVSDLRIVET